MKKIILKILLFIMPVLVISIATAFLPYNFFSFRLWEALSVFQSSYFLAGPFYPSQKMVMTEEGDLGHGTPYAIKRTVTWETDRYGYRKADSNEQPDVVVIGDSCIAGVSLSQDELFTELLQRKLHCGVYPYAPNNINHFIHDARFSTKRPKVVILGHMERGVLGIEKLQIKPESKLATELKAKALTSFNNRFMLQASIILNRTLKLEPLHKVKNMLEPKTIGYRYQDMFFYQGEQAVVHAKESEIQRAVKTISAYNDYFRKKNILFIYMPIPNKETIYYDLLPSQPEFTILKQVVQGLKHAGVPTIDLLSAFKSYKQDGKNPYQIDDTHWNPDGVRIAADLAADMIRRSK